MADLIYRTKCEKLRDNWTGTAADLTAALSLAPVVEPFDATERKGCLSCVFTCACVRVNYHSLNMEARKGSKGALRGHFAGPEYWQTCNPPPSFYW